MAPRPIHLTKSADSRFQELQALLTNRNKRFRTQSCLVQGVNPIRRALEAGWPLRSVISSRRDGLSAWARELLERCASVEQILCEPELFQALSERDELTEILLVVERRTTQLSELLTNRGPLVILDRPAYPGNLGTVLRSADAFGAAGVVLVGHAADPFDPKCIRASTGSIFSVPVAEESRSIESFAAELCGADRAIVALDEQGKEQLGVAALPKNACFIIGSEGTGLSRAAHDSADLHCAIPMQGDATSLNMAIASAVALFEYQRQHPSPL